jgi:hypothetical protein
MIHVSVWTVQNKFSLRNSSHKKSQSNGQNNGQQNHLHFPAIDECNTILTFLPCIFSDKKPMGSGQSLPQTLPEDLDLETGMGYLRHGVSWADSFLVHLEGLL